MTKKETARELYEKAGLTLAEIARQLDVSYNTVRSWKYRDSIKGSHWLEKYTSRKRCMTQSQLDNLNYYQSGNYASFKHGLFSDRLSPEALALYNAEFKDKASNYYIKAIYIEFCRFICCQRGLDYSHPRGLNEESKLAMRLCKMIASYSQIKDIIRVLDSLADMELEPEQDIKLAQIIDISLSQELEKASHYFKASEQLLAVA